MPGLWKSKQAPETAPDAGPWWCPEATHPKAQIKAWKKRWAQHPSGVARRHGPCVKLAEDIISGTSSREEISDFDVPGPVWASRDNELAALLEAAACPRARVRRVVIGSSVTNVTRAVGGAIGGLLEHGAAPVAEVRLSGCVLEAGAVSAIAAGAASSASKLRELSVHAPCALCDADLAAISGAVGSLRVLKLYIDGPSEAAVLGLARALAASPRLEEVSLDRPPAPADAAQMDRQLDDICAALCGGPRAPAQGRSFGYELAGALADLIDRTQTLASLHIGGFGIGNDGAELIAGAVARSTTLRHLNLQDNAIGDQGAKHFWTALGAGAQLESLDLSSAGVEWDGVNKVEELSTETVVSLMQSARLKFLGLRGSRVSLSDTLQKVCPLLEHCPDLVVSLLDKDTAMDGAEETTGFWALVDSGAMPFAQDTSARRRLCLDRPPAAQQARPSQPQPDYASMDFGELVAQGLDPSMFSPENQAAFAGGDRYGGRPQLRVQYHDTPMGELGGMVLLGAAAGAKALWQAGAEKLRAARAHRK
ncbi:unnamed protein product [Pedinophyceae sp. YPF-701]|nr:unnamed protein product [Pedinophyceae sp. YPF-701]